MRLRLAHVCLTILFGWTVLTYGSEEPTYAHDVAPILNRHCAVCHHPGAVGPFSVVDFNSAKAHSGQIAKAVSAGSMPPWPPAQGRFAFIDERRLDAREISILTVWHRAGAPAGDLTQAPSAPRFPTTWMAGEPDLILRLPKAYEFVGDGEDVYRNFVVPVPPGSNRFVRSFEFLPGNRAIHHARILFDNTGAARRLEAADPVCGFTGTMPPGRLPEGQFGGWVPGHFPTVARPGLEWALDGLGDMVLQLHLQRTGSPETIQPQIGLYLTNRPPTNSPIRLGLIAQSIDIAPGASNVVVSRSLVLAGEASLLSVMAHAHYLAKEVKLIASLSGGESWELLHIPRWRFNWQDEYRYQLPVQLPKGTILEMRIVYDNTSEHQPKPGTPPRRVRHGPNSTDEMAEVWLQLLPASPAARRDIDASTRRFMAEETRQVFEDRLKEQPNNAGYHLELAKNLGALGRNREAFEHLSRAVELKPDLAEAYHYIGLSYLQRELWVPAARAFARAVELDPLLQRSHVGLGLAALGAGQVEEARQYFNDALRLNPNDAAVRAKLVEIETRK
jgi:Tetratricopeptide repeat